MTASLPRQRFAWCLFDFANSAYNTVIVTFVYVAYFREVLAPDGHWGDVAWTWMLAISGLLVAVVAPVTGHMADHTARKRPWLVAFTVLTIGFTAVLGFLGPGAGIGPEPGTVAAAMTALVLVLLANTCFELTFAFYNAYLPQLAAPGRVGSLSGKGWALGYAGGLASLGVCWLYLQSVPSGDRSAAVPAVAWIVAGWFLVFALPMLAGVPDRARPAAGPSPGLLHDLRGVLRTLRKLPDHPDLMRLLIARVVYNDALMATIGLAGLYMSGTLAMEQDEIMLLGIGLNVCSGLGALAFGYVDDRLGAKPTIVASLVLMIAGAGLAVAVPEVWAFTVAAALLGLGLGPNQSASRSLLARLTAPSRSSEFYGLYALSGKSTVWLGPALFALVVGATGSQRVAFLPVIAMFVVGLVVILPLDERRGSAAAAALEATAGKV